MTKPTGYTVTISADVLALFIKVYGHTSCTERMEYHQHTLELDRKTSNIWSEWRDKLMKDGNYDY